MGTAFCCDNGPYESVAKESNPNKLVDNKRTIHRWFSIVLVWTIILSALVQFSMFSSILAPFLSMLDPSVDAFFGTLAIIAYSLGQMITPPLFGLWGNKTKKCRRPISCGLLTIAMANLVYCYLEYFPIPSRKWIMLAARFVIGLGAGAQGLFALIGYPGFYIHGFHIHAYNAPAVASVLVAIVLLFLTSMFLLEEYPGITDAKDRSFSSSSNVSLETVGPCADSSTQWCQTTPRIPINLYIVSFMFMAIGFPVANASLSTLLSKIVGPRKQGIMQGIYVTTGGSARLLGPLLTSFIFIRYGPQYAWLLSMALMLCGTCMAIICRNRLVGLITNPVLKPGQHYSYKCGILYRF
uniref:Uncharacterized protein n=1 Tax=Romanomermis culicivorax TaxID=13658 RepID=A0A915HV14_ROMCU